MSERRTTLRHRMAPEEWRADVAAKEAVVLERAGRAAASELVGFASLLMATHPDGEPWNLGAWWPPLVTASAAGALWYMALDDDWRFRAYAAADLRLAPELRAELSDDPHPEVAAVATRACPGGEVSDADTRLHLVARDPSLSLSERLQALLSVGGARSERLDDRIHGVPIEEHVEYCVFALGELAAAAITTGDADAPTVDDVIDLMRATVPAALYLRYDGWFRRDRARYAGLVRVGRHLVGRDRERWWASVGDLADPSVG